MWEHLKGGKPWIGLVKKSLQGHSVGGYYHSVCHMEFDQQETNVCFAILSQEAHLGAVTTRIEHAASAVSVEPDKGEALTTLMVEKVERQQAETIQVSAAMNQNNHYHNHSILK